MWVRPDLCQISDINNLFSFSPIFYLACLKSMNLCYEPTSNITSLVTLKRFANTGRPHPRDFFMAQKKKKKKKNYMYMSVYVKMYIVFYLKMGRDDPFLRGTDPKCFKLKSGTTTFPFSRSWVADSRVWYYNKVIDVTLELIYSIYVQKTSPLIFFFFEISAYVTWFFFFNYIRSQLIW